MEEKPGGFFSKSKTNFANLKTYSYKLEESENHNGTKKNKFEQVITKKETVSTMHYYLKIEIA